MDVTVKLLEQMIADKYDTTGVISAIAKNFENLVFDDAFFGMPLDIAEKIIEARRIQGNPIKPEATIQFLKGFKKTKGDSSIVLIKNLDATHNYQAASDILSIFDSIPIIHDILSHSIDIGAIPDSESEDESAVSARKRIADHSMISLKMPRPEQEPVTPERISSVIEAIQTITYVPPPPPREPEPAERPFHVAITPMVTRRTNKPTKDEQEPARRALATRSSTHEEEPIAEEPGLPVLLMEEDAKDEDDDNFDIPAPVIEQVVGNAGRMLEKRAPGSMKVTIVYEKSNYDFIVDPTKKVSSLNWKIRDTLGIPCSSQKLVYNGRRLWDKSIIGTQGLPDNAIIPLTVVKKVKPSNDLRKDRKKGMLL